MFNMRNFVVSTSVISSPVSAFGATPCAAPDGPTTTPSGPALAPASHSAPQESRKALTTSDTSGPSGSGSLTSAALQSSLESRLRVLSTGSILYRLTWKARVTPSGRAICALRASAARISASDSILSGWPTPHTNSTTGPGSEGREGGLNIQTAAQLAAWPTPTTRDHKDTGNLEGSMFRQDGKLRDDTVPRAAWMATPQRLCSDGTLLTGCSAAMASGGRLNPAHSRWLMRLPPEWDACAPTETASTLKRQRSSSKR